MSDQQSRRDAPAGPTSFGAEPWRPARETKAQRQWRPGRRRPRRSIQASFCSSVLCLQAIVLFFVGMTLFGLHRGEPSAPWFLAGYTALAVIAVLACAVIRRPLGLAIGWGVQVVMICSAWFEYSLFVIGPLFALTWWYAVAKGRAMDQENKRRERLEAEWDAAHGYTGPDGYTGPQDGQ